MFTPVSRKVTVLGLELASPTAPNVPKSVFFTVTARNSTALELALPAELVTEMVNFASSAWPPAAIPAVVPHLAHIQVFSVATPVELTGGR